MYILVTKFIKTIFLVISLTGTELITSLEDTGNILRQWRRSRESFGRLKKLDTPKTGCSSFMITNVTVET